MTPQTPSSSGSDSSLRGPPKSAEERLMVAVRIRPLKTDEGSSKCLYVLNNKTVVLEDGVDKHDVLRQKRGADKQYNFDVAFGEDAGQEHVYEVTTRPLVQDVLNGINATVFAYGATGAGKTHTMVGDPQHPGIMVRALNDLFNAVKDSGREDQYLVTMSYLELYNEQIRDLLNPQSGYLELREDSKGRNIQVAGLSEVSTTSTNEVMQLLQKGNKARTVEPTAMNKTSSRSHALLSVTVKTSIPLDPNSNLRMRIRQGRLFMIDLAGSERANKTKNRGKRLQEGAHINRSLLALGNCINALSGGARYVNYRDSKLTRLLKEALSGNCRTVMIAHLSPATAQKEESRNTLIYADRANHISNKVESNILDVSYHVTQYQTVINELRDEISRLRVKMQEDRPRTAELKLKMSSAQRSTEVKNLREQIVGTFKEQMKLRRKLMEIDSHLLGLGMDAERQHLVISHWESRNNKLYKATPGTASRAHTQQSIRRHEAKSSGSEHEITEDTGSDELSSGGSAGDDVIGAGSWADGGDLSVQHAWSELTDIEREQERWAELRAHVNEKLEICRKRGVELEDELPALLSSDDEREILALMCRVHELEADKMALQSERLVRQHELRRRDLVILRYDRQRQLCEEIITRQRQLMEEGRIRLPPDLQDLYQLYQQEIHASAYTDNPSKLPPLQRGSEAANSDVEMAGPLHSVDRVMGHHVTRPGQSLRFPPLSATSTTTTSSRSIRQPIPGTSGVNIRKSVSEDMLSVMDI